MKNLAVFGDPVSHSRSPEIFRYLFEKYVTDSNYTRIRVTNAEDIFTVADKYDIAGFNVTSPFKEDVFELLGEHTDPVSIQTRSVNCVIKRKGIFYGFNTDFYGVQHTLVNNGIEVNGKKCVVLGGGGAARSAVCALVDLGAKVFSCNRTYEKAKKISVDYGTGLIAFEDLKRELTDTYFLLSAVPRLDTDLSDSLKATIVLEADYRNAPLKGIGRRYIDGSEWLINQALRSYGIFFDVKAEAGKIKNEISEMKRKKNIALIGPTCSGKTTYGRIAANIAGMNFFDTDEEIERETGSRVADIFKDNGEIFFREKEHGVVSRLSQRSGILLALGAGALTVPSIRNIIKRNFFPILIETSAEEIFKRLSSDEIEKRPMLNSPDPKSSFEKMFSERKADYYSVSELIYKTGNGSVGTESERIAGEIIGR
jgi:shikimate dehydrogenase